MPNRVAHFEIQAEDPERASKFYGEVFGWDIKKWENGQMDYWMVMSGKQDEPGGINGGIVRRTGPSPVVGQSPTGYVCTIVVEDYDAMATKIEAAGGKVAMPKFALTGMAWQGYFIDTEGNTFGLHQPDVSAK